MILIDEIAEKNLPLQLLKIKKMHKKITNRKNTPPGIEFSFSRCWLILFFCCAPFYTCHEDSDFFNNQHLVRKPVDLSGMILQENSTRASDYGFVTGDRMGIYIVDRVGNEPLPLHATDNHASNVLYTYNADTYKWTSPSTIYWTDDVTPVDVYGYYPGVNYIGNPQKWDFEVEADQTTEVHDGELGGYEKSDLLWGCQKNVSPTEKTITITYYHRLAGARVHIIKGEGMTDDEWSKQERTIMVENTIRQATVDLSAGTATPKSTAGVSPICMMPQTDDDYRAVIIPQTVAAGKTLLSITIDGQTYTHKLSSAMTWQAGKLHNFTITVNKRTATGDYELKVKDGGITPWQNDEASHQFSAQAYVVVNCDKHGTLRQCISKTGYDVQTIQNLKVTGEIDSDDYNLLANEMPELKHLNLRDARSRHILVEHNWETDENRYEDDVFVGFCGNKSLRSVVMPLTTKVVGSRAFCEMRLMYSTLEVPEGVTKIGEFAFADNEYNGVELILPASLDTIENYAFLNCGYSCELRLTDNLRYIGEGAFINLNGEGCPNFHGVFHFPSKITKLAPGMFHALGSEGSFTGEIEIPQGVTEIPGDGVFGVALKNKISVILPAGLKRLMSGFPNLASIHFNDDLELIGRGAFYNSKLFFPLQFPESLREIQESAFFEAQIEGELVIPERCLNIGERAFGRNQITKVTLPSKLETIPNDLFYDNPNLREVTIPKYVEYIGDYAFATCPMMQTIVSLNPEPPALANGVFTIKDYWEDGMFMDKVILQVPESSVELYRHAAGWSDFKNITPYRELAFNIPKIVTLDRGNTLEGIIRAEGAWEVSECPDWVTVSPSSGTGKAELTVKVAAMSGDSERSGRIVFRLKDKDYTYYTDVSQYSSSELVEDKTFLLQKASAGAPFEIPIFIVGEGYGAKEIVSGQYLDDMREQMEYLFSCEPYKTYRNYFTVSTAIACSPESGLDGRTRFESGMGWGAFSTNQELLWKYACEHGVGLSDGSHSRAVVLMLMNTNQTLNTVELEDDGFALAMLGKSTDSYPFGQRELVLRDVGGRAFGHLGSEAINHYTFIKACTCSGCKGWEDYLRGKLNGWYENISISGKMNEVPWSHLIFHPSYSSQVDIYEGAYNHARGTYRSEQMSVMGNVPVPYFNTISRESIVRRIKQYSGQVFTFDDFVANDKMELP